MNVQCALETRESKKKGVSYSVLVVRLTPTYEKLVFLTKAEKELLNATNKNDMDF